LTIGNNLNYLTINSTAYDKYKLVVTYNQDGITFTGSDEIIVSSPFCCSTGSELTTAYGDYSSSNFPFATNGPGNTKLISNSTLALNGSLTIDQNTVISASHLQLNSQYKITVLNGKTLTINAGSVLEGCTYRWNGIEVQPGGQIYVQDNCLLKDADYAVDIKNNSQLSSIYNITKTQFSKNYYSIRITNQLNFGSNYIAPNLRTQKLSTFDELIKKCMNANPEDGDKSVFPYKTKAEAIQSKFDVAKRIDTNV
jgi:hypothetical protein